MPRGRLSAIFLGPYGIRAGWRVLIFLALAVILAVGLGLGLRRIKGSLNPDATGLLSEFILLASSLTAIWFIGRFEGPRVWSYGFAGPNRTRNLVVGSFTGIATLSVLMLLLAAVGAYRSGPPSLHGMEATRWGCYWALLFTATAFGEESLTRSYALFALTQGIGFWPAAALLSIMFGAGHLGNSGEEWVGIVNAMLVGVVFAYSVKWTGSLWWAIGAHFTWDWGETFLYGVADSGFVSPHHLLSWRPVGAGWLSGGSVGPEGSVLAAPLLLAMALAMRLSTSPWENSSLVRRRRPATTVPAAPNSSECPSAGSGA
jgi:membrane protease YdiL (CAAX protease family)